MTSNRATASSPNSHPPPQSIITSAAAGKSQATTPCQPSSSTHASTPQAADPHPQTINNYSTMAPLTPALRRKNSLGPLRRAHPASGATWNVEVIRGKMTSRCLWHACRALVLGMILMIVGAGMATIGYYAVPLSTGQEVRGNSTAFIKNISRGYHLNNLSYIGPIVMGFGGFIVVAACVMTFEARDSAAKVVPARFKMSTVGNSMGGVGGGVGSGSGRARNSSGIRRGATGSTNCGGGGGGGAGPSSVGSQTTRWDSGNAATAGGLYRASPGDKYPDRQALTAALIHFSRALGTPGQSPSQSRRISRVSRSGSVPNLHGESIQSPNKHCFASKGGAGNGGVGYGGAVYSSRHHHGSGNHYHSHRHNNSGHHHRRSGSRHSSLTKRHTREHTDRFLHPGMLKYHRHALSVDESHPPPCLRPILSNNASQSSMTVSGAVGYIVGSNSSPTHEIMRHIKRSDTAKQHVLARQRNIEKEDNNNAVHSPKGLHSSGRRRSSTASDASMASRHTQASSSARRASTASRTPSIDSRCCIPHQGPAEANSIEGISMAPTTSNRVAAMSSSSPKSWRVSAQLSTPSVDREFRSQLSICSEPAMASSTSPKALSCQSSIEPCVPEEEDTTAVTTSPESEKESVARESVTETAAPIPTKQRPDTLILECPLSQPETVPSKYLTNTTTGSSFKRKRPPPPPLQPDVGEIYFISSATDTSKDYDSIEVIDERRNKNFGHVGPSAGSATTHNNNESRNTNVTTAGTMSGNATHSGINTNLERTDTVIYRDVKDNSNRCGTKKAIEDELPEELEDRATVGNAVTTLTILAEIEQPRGNNTDTNNSNVR